MTHQTTDRITSRHVTSRCPTDFCFFNVDVIEIGFFRFADTEDADTDATDTDTDEEKEENVEKEDKDDKEDKEEDGQDEDGDDVGVPGEEPVPPLAVKEKPKVTQWVFIHYVTQIEGDGGGLCPKPGHKDYGIEALQGGGLGSNIIQVDVT